MNRISVITICFNNPEDVIKTCASVDMQEMKPYEHIIVDGSTKPGIKEWLENNLQPAYRRWQCERDKGISDAFNKGIALAKGEITTLLNSGDTLYDNSILQRVHAVFASDPSVMWTNGRLNMFRAGVWSVTGKRFEKDKLYRGMHGVFHPTMYVKKEVYGRRGGFDLGVKYAMDYDFICRIADEKSAFVDYPIATFDPGGVSTNNYIPSTKEMFRCYQKYFGKSLKQTLWSWRLFAIHYVLRSSAGKWLYKMKVNMGMQKI